MVGTADVSATAELDTRYGRTPGKRNRDRWIIAVMAAVFIMIFTAWVIWAGLDGTKGSLEAVDIGHSIHGDDSVSVTWDVSVAAGTPVSCALQTQNESHGIVGWKIVSLPASERYTTRYTETVRTAQQSVTGLIYRCWLT